MNTRALTRSCLALSCLVALSCGPSQKDIQDIRAKQDEILTKLNAIQDAQNKLVAARQGPPAEDFDKVYAIAVGDSPIRGDQNASVTIVEFSDFQCPFCAKAAPLIDDVLKKYPKGVRFVYKQFPLPFHQAARPAALWSMAAQSQGKFWEMHDVLIDAQPSLTAEQGEALAKKAGLDLKRFKADLEKNTADYNKRIDAEVALGNVVDVRGTPTIYIGGKKVRVRTLDGMSSMIDAELAKPAS